MTRLVDTITASVLAAAVVRQALDHIASGRGPASEEDYDRFIEEANAIAEETLGAIRRFEHHHYSDSPPMEDEAKEATMNTTYDPALVTCRRCGALMGAAEEVP